MHYIKKTAYIVCFVLLVLNALDISILSYAISRRNLAEDPDTFLADDITDIRKVPALFWTILFVEMTRLVLSLGLLNAIRNNMFFYIYLWILIKVVYVMLIFIILPLSEVWYRHATRTLHLIQAWISFPFYVFSIYVMMFLYSIIQEIG